MTGSVRAELLVVRRRASTWILFAIWVALALVFAYAVPYATYRNGTAQEPPAELLPAEVVGTIMGGFPFFGGVLALVLGVLSFGSEYGWGTVKTLLTQRPGRLHVFGAKLVALALALVPFVLGTFAAGALASLAVALTEGADVAWPSIWLVARGLAAAWLVLAVWAALGVLLGVASRGTGLAVGLGVLYALVIEGLLSALASQVSLLDRLVELAVRANAYSLAVVLGASSEDAADNGPGSFAGPFVDARQAVLVLAAYAVALLVAAGWLVRRRDVA